MKKYLLLLILPILMYANVGEVTVLKGDVKIQRVNKTIQAKSGSILQKNDFIKTSKDGKVQIVFTDKTVFTIGKNSTLDIADYLYDEAQPKKNKAKFNVLKGAFSSITGRIGKLNKSKFKLKTKSASIGIRGTIVKANQETILCTEGAITVTTLNGITVRIDAGQKTNVSTGTPSAPEAYTESDEKSLDSDAEYLGKPKDVASNDKKASEKEDKKSSKKTDDAQESEGTTSENENSLVTNDDVSNIQTDISSDSIASDVAQNVADEKAAEDAANAAEETTSTRELTLTGKTISSDGTVQNMQIEVNNLDGAFSTENDQISITDDQGNVVDSTKDETVTWGHWVDDPTKKWVAGKVTDVQVLDKMRNDQTNTVNAAYSGQAMGTVNGSDDIKIDGNNEVKVNFALGGGKNTMDGSMKFGTKAGQSWSSTFSGTTSETTFSSTSVGGASIGSSGAKAITSGNVDGSFYGDNAEAVGGAFNLETESDKATGVFKATK